MDDYRVKQNGEREREREKEGGVSWQFACSVDSSPHIYGKKMWRGLPGSQ